MKIDALFDVRGLTAVVTGGASGIGLACAEAMAENGAAVIVVDVNASALEQAVRRLSVAGAGRVRGMAVDVTEHAALSRAFDTVAAEDGRIDVVFANAGIGGGPGFLTPDGARHSAGALEFVDDALWDRLIAVNLTSVFTTIQCAARHMKKQKAGRIIVTTSIAATRVEPWVGLAYQPAKAAAAHLARQAALELARYNIQVNAIAPGPFITGINRERLADPAARAAFAALSPMHRAAMPEEIQGLALFLASRAASYVTGAQMVIDGGVSLGRAD
jgi:NAD(P)-dependent dehydrogenase (short-subunit alcohol dehydrogenase family)